MIHRMRQSRWHSRAIGAQQMPTIRVRWRLVTYRLWFFSSDNRLIPACRLSDFRVLIMGGCKP